MSKEIVIEVVNVGEEQTIPTARGGYKQFELAYKSEGRVNGKVLRDFSDKAVYEACRSLQPKDVATVVIAKEAGRDGREFWNWKSVSAGGSAPASQTAAASAAKPTGRVTGSNYETPEERAQRQVFIVRQSSITAALKILEMNGKNPSVTDVILLSEQLKNYVFEGIPSEVKGQIADYAVPAKAKAKPKAKAVDPEFADLEDDVPL